MMNDQQDKDKGAPRRGVYFLPNLFTTLGLFAAFYSIVASMQQHFVSACIAIFIAMVADGLDGRIARLTHTTSAFGASYDSLSDLVAFGLAPALLVYAWSLHALGKLGWLCAFFYVAATALRLARFNTQLADADKRFFIGLSSPAAAGLLVGFVWAMHEYKVVAEHNQFLSISLAVMTVVVAALMVSNLRYSSFKLLDFSGRVSFALAVFGVVMVVAIAFDPAQVLFYAFAIYAASGVLAFIWRQLFCRKKCQKPK